MKVEPDEPLLDAVKAVITGKSNEEVIPALIVASARALALEANGDPERLERLDEKFCDLLANTATDLLNEGSVH